MGSQKSWTLLSDWTELNWATNINHLQVYSSVVLNGRIILYSHHPHPSPWFFSSCRVKTLCTLVSFHLRQESWTIVLILLPSPSLILSPASGKQFLVKLVEFLSFSFTALISIFSSSYFSFSHLFLPLFTFFFLPLSLSAFCLPLYISPSTFSPLISFSFHASTPLFSCLLSLFSLSC